MREDLREALRTAERRWLDAHLRLADLALPPSTDLSRGDGAPAAPAATWRVRWDRAVAAERHAWEEFATALRRWHRDGGGDGGSPPRIRGGRPTRRPRGRAVVDDERGHHT